ncbi:hypothetical protein PTH_2507 [Pelotomaculum thermopropionicum SI]|uniref:Plasmid encoded RepA protein n=1 Tax=Pelotomaculum thermopropionicum (strain DSM 13744 / JCM 10971 / SI) TaxID=370438 RepID=A5CZ82_PELTS|nr:hypothetical protein PTH_2507 [Pelotomaculum thermopropionicum SI]
MAQKTENPILPRNLAREGRLLNPPEKLFAGEKTIQKPTGPTSWDEERGPAVGYRAWPDGPSVYVPEPLAEALSGLPADVQALIAVLCTLFVAQADDTVRNYHAKYPGMTHGPIKTSLREIAERLGFSSKGGKNLHEITQTLDTLMHTHIAGFVMADKDGKEIKIGIGRLLTWVNLKWKEEDFSEHRFEKGLVEMTLCPALTDFLLSPECFNQRVEIPIDALRILRKKPRRSKYSIPLFLFLLAANPGHGKEFRIGWEKAAERACIPNQTESGRQIRPSERKKLVYDIMQDIHLTKVFTITERDGVFSVKFPVKGKLLSGNNPKT